MITQIGDSTFGFAAAGQADGKILVGGATVRAGVWALALARYGADGQLDAGFGDGGVVETPMADGGFIHAILVQPDGRIVVSGGTLGPLRTWILARYTAAGVLDSTFGTDGIVSTSHTADGGYGLAVQPGGSIVATNGTGLGRFDSTGAPDSTFGIGGWIDQAFGSSGEIPQVMAVQVTPAGGILVAGGLNGTDGVRRFTVARYSSDGVLDPSFGTGGVATTTFGGRPDAIAQALALDDLGRILAVGAAGNDVLVARLETNGGFDASFGGSGAVFLPFGGSVYPAALVQQADGRIVVAASSNSLLPAQPVIVARYVR